MGDVSDDASATSPGEFNGGFDFGQHGAGFEIAVFDEVLDFGGGNLMQRFLLW